MLVRSTPKQHRQLRQVLHWLRVITLADLVDPMGYFIPEGRFTGEWQADSRLKWPSQPKPDKAAFATFRQFLRNTIFVKISPWQRPSAPMHLPTPLGAWFDVEHHVTTGMARLGKHIYVTDQAQEQHVPCDLLNEPVVASSTLMAILTLYQQMLNQSHASSLIAIQFGPRNRLANIPVRRRYHRQES